MFLRALAAAIALACASLPASAGSPETFAVRLDDAADGQVCSGFHARDRLVGFAGHCVVRTIVTPPAVEGGEIGVTRTARLQFTVRLDNDSTVIGDLVGYSDPAFGGDDWAVLRIRGDVPADWPEAKLDCSGAAVPMGTRVQAIGYPALNDPEAPTLSEGFINGRERAGAGMWHWPLMHLTLPEGQGASGSALQRVSDGAVIGIFVARNDSQGAWSYAQAIAPVCAALHIQ